MLGLLWGAKLEAQTGNTITQQAQSRPVVIAAVVALTTIASLIPIMKGVKSEAFGALLDCPCRFTAVLTYVAQLLLLQRIVAYACQLVNQAEFDKLSVHFHR